MASDRRARLGQEGDCSYYSSGVARLPGLGHGTDGGSELYWKSLQFIISRIVFDIPPMFPPFPNNPPQGKQTTLPLCTISHGFPGLSSPKLHQKSGTYCLALSHRLCSTSLGRLPNKSSRNTYFLFNHRDPRQPT